MTTDADGPPPGGRLPARAAPQIAVIGGASASPATLADAEAVGRALARAGAGLVCGGLGGVMEAACRGAAEAGGFTVGLLPGDDPEDANPYLACVIPTGLGHFRNFLVVQAARAVIALPGASGTQSEAAMARTLDKPVVTLFREPPGWGVPGAVAARSAEEAVRLAIRAAAE